jgi:hypothetical protein
VTAPAVVRQLALADLGRDELGIKALRELPYQVPPYSARNWGHPFHSMCSYPSKIKPAIAHFLVKLFTAPGETVLDPFCGVGTIPFEACSQGRVGLGSDLNPLAAIVTRAKIDPPGHEAVEVLLGQLEEALADPEGGEVDEEIASFFHPRTLDEIFAARRLLLECVASSATAREASFLLSCLAHVLHGNRPYALSRRSHNVIPIPPKGDFVYKPLMASLRPKVDRLLRIPLPETFVPGAAARASFADARDFVPEVDHVISSPPFLGTTHFVRQNRLRLWLCGWDYVEQEEAKPQFLEHQRGIDPYRAILPAVHEVLRDGGRCVLHLGVVKSVDMAAAIAPEATDAGFDIDAIVYEDTAHLESHGRTDRGGTHRHQFLVLTRNRHQPS